MENTEKKPPVGQIIDGVAASAAVDSAGERLDINGLDITDFKNGTAVLNYEHEGPENGHGMEIVGKIIYARKIFQESDCETPRQLYYWNQVKLPFVYIIGRLYDAAGHPGAQAIAAQIRDHAAQNEKVLCRFSIEGNTLEKEGNLIKYSVARRCAITTKPCNKQCNVNLVADPSAPEGFNKQPVPDAQFETLGKFQLETFSPYQKLGKSYELELRPFQSHDLHRLLKTVMKVKLLKTLTAGSYNAAPSTLSGGTALQREHIEDKIKNVAKGFKFKVFKKDEFKTYMKAQLPEIDDKMLDKLANLIEETHLKNSTKLVRNLEALAIRLSKTFGF